MQETLDPLDESKYILKEIQKYMKKGVDLKQMAILYRQAKMHGAGRDIYPVSDSIFHEGEDSSSV